MRHIQRALILPHVLGAIVTTIAVWILASTIGSSWAQRFYHTMLDEATPVARDVIGDANTATLKQRLPVLEKRLEGWNLTAAAFDRTGEFVAGDERLGSTGLPSDSLPNGGLLRQVAIVPTQDGYLLLAPDPQAVREIRTTTVFWAIVTVILIGLTAWAYGSVWSRERARSVARLRDGLRAVASGAPGLEAQDDPLYGEVWQAAAAAVRRLHEEARDSAAGEERLRAFLADAGHELRTPLAIAVGYLGILRRGGVADPALSERIVRDVSVEHERLSQLVERILQLARLDALMNDPNATSDVTRVTQEAIALVRPLAPDSDIELEASANVFATVPGDDLRDALRNLLENAVRYAPGAPIRVQVDVAAGAIVIISVRDEGPGMDAFTAAHAFDRFFRGADRGEIPGTGLGLAIVRRIVERAGGSVSLITAPAEGTTVEMRLPLARVALHQREPIPGSEVVS